MSRRLLFTVMLLQLMACEQPYNNSPSELALAPNSSPEILQREVQHFYSFMDSLDNNSYIKAPHSIQQQAIAYFPDSTIHRDHWLYGRSFALADSSQIIYYEYSLDQPGTSNAYLGLFSKDGEVRDLMKINEVSYDGSVTIKLIDHQVLEIEYYDFFDSNQLFKPERYSDRNQRMRGKPYWQRTAQRENNGDIVDYYYYENYSIDAKGNFKLLKHNEFIELGRQYPFLSLRVLSQEELSVLSAKKLRRMINEIYAAHGFIFQTETLQDYYKDKSWYRPRHASVEPFISDIERINIKKMAALEAQKLAVE
ncbi:MAG: YARHG domain-containing protein [Bacteroidota bacterium]